MIRRLIARIFRWVHKIFSRYSTFDMDENARGLAEFLIPPPLTKEEKDEHQREQVLQGVKPEDRESVIDHFNKLDKESDPLDNVKETPWNSVKKVGIDISVEDVKSRFGQRDDANDTVRAKNAIVGLGDWPVPANKNTKGKN